MADRIATLIATWFGCGYAPQARGTVGSAAAAALALLAAKFLGWQPWHLGLLAAAMLAPAIWASSRVARLVGREDPNIVVVDEVVGQWIALAGASHLNAISLLAGFFLFRLFDIRKPAPVRQLERLPAGWGIVADDVMAGLYAALVLFLGGCFNLY